ncbi:carboxylesterase family protein, partial [Mycolicibacterium insubricum]|nr:carboxylesterase family protein [Mycolicibacterium insubricum]
PIGAGHALDLRYLFDIAGGSVPDAAQRALSAQMIRYWAAFVTNATPNAETPDDDPDWPQLADAAGAVPGSPPNSPPGKLGAPPNGSTAGIPVGGVIGTGFIGAGDTKRRSARKSPCVPNRGRSAGTGSIRLVGASSTSRPG